MENNINIWLKRNIKTTGHREFGGSHSIIDHLVKFLGAFMIIVLILKLIFYVGYCHKVVWEGLLPSLWTLMDDQKKLIVIH